jgi:GNAT superfamily N-acetyltransferase
MADAKTPKPAGLRGEDVDMIRPTLNGIGEYPLAEGYRLRGYRDGDEAAWTHIWMTADIFSMVTPETFGRQFGERRDALPERMFFLCGPDGGEVGTATAWFPNTGIDAEAGLVHWVAIRPQVQGQHLGKPLMAAVLNRLRDLGYSRAALCTQEGRLAAINLYLELDFVPVVRSDEDRAAWKRVRSQLHGSRLEQVDLDG